MKEFADDNFKFDENGRKLSKQVEDTVGKGEIALYEQFLLFPQCFKRLVSQGCQKVPLCGNGLIIYHLSAIETLVIEKLSLNGSTSYANYDT